ncbi:MAG: DUF4209 domain-containing protein [Acidobacteria bacterium]|nr:DUF4209 domain-containing protein [Acidobacteriota bacterium]
MKIPNFVEELISRYEKREDSFNEVEIHDALSTSRKANPDLDQEEFEGFRAEASAFFFYERRGKDSIGGTYFAPMFSATQADGTRICAPDIKVLNAEVIAYWQQRAKESKHPVLRARYADLVWDMTQSIVGERPDVEFARIATDAYLEAVDRGFYTIAVQGIRWCERALDIALSISDKDRVRRIVEFMFHFHDRVPVPQHIGTWIFLFDDLYGRRDLISTDQEKMVITRLENVLTVVTDRGTGEAFNPWAAEAAAARLERHYTNAGRKEEVERVVKCYGETFETLAKEASSTLAMAWLQPVVEKYKQTGMKTDAERAQLLSQEKAKNVAAEMKRVSAKIELKREDMEAYLDWITGGDLRAALVRIATRFIPDVKDARQFLKRTAEEFPLQALMGVVKVDEGKIVAQAGSVQDDEEGRLHMQLAQNIQISQFFLVHTLEKLRDRHVPTVNQLLDFLYESPIFEESDRRLLEEGLSAYEKEDYVKAIHVLIPRIEHSLRNVLSLLGIPTNKQVRGHAGIMQAKNVNDILADERIKTTLGESLWRYLQVFLADKRGQNLRNQIAHGLLGIEEFNRPVADQVFHVLLAISLLRKK